MRQHSNIHSKIFSELVFYFDLRRTNPLIIDNILTKSHYINL